MVSRFAAGETLEAIGESYGLTRQRVHQIVRKLEPDLFGGLSKKVSDRMAEERSVWEAKKGIEKEVYDRLRKIGDEMLQSGRGAYQTPLYAYRMQQRNAHDRGIEFKLTRQEWWDVWQLSGKWEQRGRGSGGYVMCRKADEGAYEVGNVYIDTNAENMRHYHLIAKPKRASACSFA